MSTKAGKKRISISADKDIEEALTQAAKRDGVLVTTKATELLRLALELEEDMALASLAEQRTKRPAKFLSHDQVWKHFK
jgi:hypothetical protein